MHPYNFRHRHRHPLCYRMRGPAPQEDVEEELDDVELEGDVFFYFALKVLSLNSKFRERRVGQHQNHSRPELLRSSCFWCSRRRRP